MSLNFEDLLLEEMSEFKRKHLVCKNPKTPL